MIYICIPAHNEERTIGVLLWKIRQVLADFPRDYQILVANDGSTDGTAEVLAPYQRVLPLTVFQTHRQRGYASSLEQLLREAVRRAEYPKRDVIITLQGDFTDDPNSIAAMLKKIEAGADLVCAQPTIPANASRAHRWGRRIGGYLVGRRKWPEGVSDPLCGFRAYRVMIVKRALEQRGGQRLLSWNGWLANAELLRDVAPHSRRNETIETETRLDRLQRPSRLALWPAVKSMLSFARGARGPMSDVPFEASESMHDARGPRRRGAAQLREDLGLERSPGRGKHGTTNGRRRGHEGERRRERGPRTREREQPEGRKRAEPRERSRPEARTRSERPERPQRGERAEARARPERRERPKREPREPQLEAVEETALNAGSIAAENETAPAKKKRRRRRRKRTADGNVVPLTGETTGAEEAADAEESSEIAAEGNAGEQSGEVKKKRRSRRGRGRRGRRKEGAGQAEISPDVAVDSVSHEPAPAPVSMDTETNRVE